MRFPSFLDHDGNRLSNEQQEVSELSESDRIPNSSKRRCLAAASAAMAMLVLDSSVVGTMLPSIGAELHLTESTLTWVVSSYLLAIGVMLPIVGRLVDWIGPGPAYATGCIGFAAASAGIGIASSGAELVVWRTLAGVAAAILMPATTALIVGTFPTSERTRAIAIYTAVGQAFSLFGPAIGGFFAQFLGWRYGFLINIPVGLCAVGLLASSGMARYRVPRPHPAAVARGPRFWNRNFVVSSLVLTGLGFAMTIATVFGAAEVQRTLDLTPFQAGLALLPLVAAVLLTTRWVATTTTISARTFGFRGGTLTAVGLTIMAAGFQADSLATICAGMLPTGAGIALLMAPMTGAALSSQPAYRHGAAAAVSASGRQLGAALAPLAFGVIAAAYGSALGFIAAATIMAVCTFAASFLRNERSA